MLWNTIESCASIVTACLPTYVPLLQNTRIGTWLRSISSGVQASLMSRRNYPPSSNRKSTKAATSSITSLNQTGEVIAYKGSSVTYGDAQGESIEMGNGAMPFEQA